VSGHRRIWTISNALTMTRAAFVPLFCWIAVQQTVFSGFLAIAVFLLASITDAYDGKIARARNEITDFGKLADPIADKALTGAAFVVLSRQGLFPWWATGLLLFREWGITIWRLAIRNRFVHAANSGGKLKTTLQITGIAVAFWPHEGLLGWLIQPLGLAIVWAAFIVTMWTGLTYVRELRAA
jgi:CDP-diacylglycerol--glycerol-3-phosphate 3-phosphatidyltransferase